MAFDLWTHQYCLSCDKQVQTDGAAYCSESCRLADQEKADHDKTLTPSSQASSPAYSPSGYPWSTTQSSPASSGLKFYLAPAYDFSNAQPYGNASVRSHHFEPVSTNSTTETSSRTLPRSLTPSSSHSSLCSMQSTSTTAESAQLSERSRQELTAYAISLEHVRLQRRRSY
ncbi:hypothetical protein AAL_03122 [Moelleriella libera RCEF 2490]|uniref:Life-span regulatory factor n=1 Tax=Moelleriella libera RCEF 2490 TaxID=1081109 RepID=A0A168EAM6_9HYPO|nr:hypothetical protein AAL_03122 [Moelleriella libera RCEF 2490]